jgi:hypothetical protein
VGRRPLRVMVSRKVDRLFAAGSSASGVPDTLLRVRSAARHTGQVGGMAAALAVQQDVQPRRLDVRMLQSRLLEAGLYLGDSDRLHDLGLARPDKSSIDSRDSRRPAIFAFTRNAHIRYNGGGFAIASP